MSTALGMGGVVRAWCCPSMVADSLCLAAVALFVLTVITWQRRGTVASTGALIALFGGQWWALVDTWTAMMAAGLARLDLFPVAKSVSVAAVTLCTLGLWISTRSMLRPAGGAAPGGR
ncbi:MAG: hypothetical protein IPK24_15285 [Kineosporiaceae bacterium]|nr:hypothetical protein [Kineosporiaceae bacterium]MBK8076891.1 hypothetical protein [Kineosporiaceae bacterium]